MATKITILAATAAGITTEQVDVTVTVKCVLAHLGIKKLDVMSTATRRPDGSVVVCVAQEKAWTWITYVFVP